MPTLFECPFTADGDFDPAGYLALAKPKIEVESGSAFALAPIGRTGATFSRSFGLISGGAAPGDAFAFAASLADGATVGGDSGGAGLTVADAAAEVRAVLKTPKVYHDEATVEVAYQLFDSTGRTAVLMEGLEVELRLTVLTAEGMASSKGCAVPDPATGVGLCSTEVGASWFSTSGPETATAVVAASYSGSSRDVESVGESLSLVKEPSFSSLAAAGMFATLPHHPLLEGGTFSVAISANTDGQDLSVWVLDVAFDAGLLTYVSTATAAAYTPAVVTTGTGSLAMSTSGLRSGVAPALVTGDTVAVATLTFTVKQGADIAQHGNVLSFTVTQMVNQYSIAFGSGLAGQVNDERGGAETEAQLTVSELAYAGIFAWSPLNELVNTAPLTGVPVGTALSAVAVFNWAGLSNAAVAATCALASAGDAAVLSVDEDTCALTATAAHTAGSAGVAVAVSVAASASLGGTATTSATVRVWFPAEVTLAVSDSELGVVVPESPHGFDLTPVLKVPTAAEEEGGRGAAWLCSCCCCCCCPRRRTGPD